MFARITKLNKSRDGQQIDLEVTYYEKEKEGGFTVDRVFTIGDLDRIKDGEEQQFIEEFVRKEGQIYKTTVEKEEKLIEKIELNKEIEI